MTTWPNTTDTPCPTYLPYGAALWLLGRHPQLTALVDRIPGAVTHPDGETELNPLRLAEALNAFDATRIAMPHPSLHEAVDAVAVMSRTERTRLRLLAFLSPARVALALGDLDGLDDEGTHLLDDWWTALRASV